MSIVTLLADPAKRNLTEVEVAALAKKSADSYEILEEGVAARLYGVKDQAFSNRNIDIIFHDSGPEKIRLLVCDMESTIISNEFLDEIADYLGIGPKVAKITERAMNGELNFNGALKERIKLVDGLPEDDIRKLIKQRLKYNRGAKELISWCRENDVYTMLVSGGFTSFTEVVANELGFDEHHANILLFTDGRLSGVADPILGKEAKLNFLKTKAEEMGISLKQTASLGDGANDLPMLEAAGLGIAYYAKPAVKKVINKQINHASLAEIRFLLN